MVTPTAGSADETTGTLEKQMWRGLTWSFINTLAGRLGSFLAGIVIARVVAPQDFGVFAVALVALNLLLSMNELGVSVAVVRHPGSVAGIAPTVTSLAIATSAALFVMTWFAAEPFAGAMGVPEATGVVRLMSVAVLVDGFAAVPAALLTRAFLQARRMRIDLIGFAVGTPVTIMLALAGQGAWSLAWGAVVGSLVTGVLSVLWAPAHYRPGFDRSVVGGLLGFGLPLAGASLLLLALVNVDFVVVGRALGTAKLGLYFLAFNLSMWPMVLVSSTVRRVTTAAYARLHARGDGQEGFRQSLYLVVSLGALLSALLAAYASGVVSFLYGERWAVAAAVVPALVILSVVRMLAELSYDYLAAVGQTLGNAWLHGLWLLALVPALIVGAAQFGIRGVAWGHALVALIIVVPGLGILLHRAGSRVWQLVADLTLPAVGSLGVLLSAWLVKSVLPAGFLTLAVGGVTGCVIYSLIVGPRFLRTLRELLGSSSGVGLSVPGRRSNRRNKVPSRLEGPGRD